MRQQQSNTHTHTHRKPWNGQTGQSEAHNRSNIFKRHARKTIKSDIMTYPVYTCFIHIPFGLSSYLTRTISVLVFHFQSLCNNGEARTRWSWSRCAVQRVYLAHQGYHVNAMRGWALVSKPGIVRTNKFEEIRFWNIGETNFGKTLFQIIEERIWGDPGQHRGFLVHRNSLKITKIKELIIRRNIKLETQDPTSCAPCLRTLLSCQNTTNCIWGQKIMRIMKTKFSQVP